jgi:hypothetical protein
MNKNQVKVFLVGFLYFFHGAGSSSPHGEGTLFAINLYSFKLQVLVASY